MESDLQQQLNPHQSEPMGSGLMRYQSAPSSYLSIFLDSDDFFPRRPLSPETERLFFRFMNSGNDPAGEVLNQRSQPVGSIKSETILHEHPSQTNNFYQAPPMKMEDRGGANNSNLVRQRSSPAGLFSNINIDNELASYNAMRNIRAGYGSCNNEPSFSGGSSRVPGPSSLRTIAENVVKPMEGGVASIQGAGGFNKGLDENYVTGFPIGSWDDSAVMSNNVSGRKRGRDDDESETQLQRGEVGCSRPPILAHHLSLQKTSAEMAAIENFFQFQDSVPCKIRAKRGCATHPRSIAERVRRTKISERMRKLQELVPNMDKQTNTSDMLDLAVNYIKELQQEVQILSDNRSKCTCPHKQQS